MTKIWNKDTKELKEIYHRLEELDKEIQAEMKKIDSDINAPYPSLSQRVYEHKQEIIETLGERELTK